MFRIILALTLIGTLAHGKDQEAAEKPAVRDLGNGKFEVGTVTFDQKTREISFLGEVNMNEGALEYAIVHHKGKIHEAIITTKTRPFHVNIALKVLAYKESKELFPILDEDYRPTGKFPQVPEATKIAARAEIHLEWKNKEGKSQTATLNDWITHTVTKKPLPPKPWVYGGSYIHDNTFQAESSGDIVALFTNNASLFNWPGEDGQLDDVWLPTTARIPEVGTVLKITIKPFIKNKKTSKLEKIKSPWGQFITQVGKDGSQEIVEWDSLTAEEQHAYLARKLPPADLKLKGDTKPIEVIELDPEQLKLKPEPRRQALPLAPSKPKPGKLSL